MNKAPENLSARSLFKKPPVDPVKRKKNLFFDAIVLVVAGILIYFFAPNPLLFASDFVRNWMTSTPAPIETLVANLRLTSKGKFVFGAVDPQLESKDVFNSACPSAEEGASSLGCYDSNLQKVHILYVESEELAGEIEATAAHELLHAAWERLSNYDRSRLEPLLLSVYNSDEYHEQLAESTKDYAPEAFLTELHSQIAERIKDLPPELERHYAKYFEDQDLIVSYFEKYSNVFKDLIAKVKTLLAEIEAERTAVEKQASDYEAWLSDYNARVDKFNNCARDPECSLVNFETKRDELIAEGYKLDAAYATYEAALNTLNAKIDDYNNNFDHLKSLDRALDSRASPKSEAKIETEES